MPDDTQKEYRVEDHAYRLYKHMHGIDDDVKLVAFDAGAAHAAGRSVTKSTASATRCCLRAL